MRLVDERTGLEVIPRDECIRLLETQAVGRIGVVVAGRPLVMPVNFIVHRGDIVLRTDPGTKFDAAVRGEFVAFEADQVSPMYHEGWSVLVTGVAEEITEAHALAEARTLPLRPWAKGAKSHFVRIVPVTVSGRRIRSS